MAEQKTKPTNQSVKEFLNQIPDQEATRRLFCGRKNHGGDYRG